MNTDERYLRQQIEEVERTLDLFNAPKQGSKLAVETYGDEPLSLDMRVRLALKERDEMVERLEQKVRDLEEETRGLYEDEDRLRQEVADLETQIGGGE